MTRASLVLAACAALGGIALPLHSGHAAYIKRDFLLRTCSSRNAAELGDCTGYVIGVADAGLSAAGGTPDFCVPDDVPVKHLREVVVTWLQGHHSGANEPAAPLVRDALKAAYPCNGSPKK